MFVSTIVDITIISIVLFGVSQAVQARFINRDEMKRQQEGMKAKQVKMKELMKKGDAKSKNELDAMEKEMMEDMQKMMSGSYKVMLVSMVVFLPALWFLNTFYGNAVIDMPVPLPWLRNGFDLFSIGSWGIEIYAKTNWFGWYFVCFIVISLLYNFISGFKKKMVAAQNG